MKQDMTMGDPIDAGMSDGETIRLKVKPNAFLYALEASRFPLLIMFAMLALLFAFALLKTGVPTGLATRIALIVYGLSCLMLLAGVMIAARCTVFMITNRRVIMRTSVMGKVSDKISISIGSIESVEVRCYDTRHGSVYLNCCKTLPDQVLRSDISGDTRPVSLLGAVKQPRPLASPAVRSGRDSIWFSTPSSLAGFYGFRHFDLFATLIVELHALIIDSPAE
jgi:hypothetical protein